MVLEFWVKCYCSVSGTSASVLIEDICFRHMKSDEDIKWLAVPPHEDIYFSEF